MGTDATPQGSLVNMEPMEEAFMTTPTIEATKEIAEEPTSEADAAPQEPTSTLGLNEENLFQFPVFLPKGAGVTHSPKQRQEESVSIPMASNLK